jgi:magnesium transporter
MSENKRTSSKAGLPPGALVHIGKHSDAKTSIDVIEYDPDHFTEKDLKNTEECFPYKDSNKVAWINVNGLNDVNAIGSIGEHFNLHPLLVEDILNTNHRPKLEEFDDCIFVTLKMLGITKNSDSIISEQVSFVLGNNWILSFQEIKGDIFDTIRERIRESKGNVRFKNVDYLLYRLIDTVVDNYFFVTEHISEQIENLEEKVLKISETQTLTEIQNLKKEIIGLRKVINPLRDSVGALHNDTGLIQQDTKRYFRDVYEHIIHLNESLDSQRDLLASLMDLYLSGVSNKMNKVMQLLTIISTIFIPLTFIAGVYGMNFSYMPELEWKYSYFVVWILMIILFIVMIIYFRRKKWL